ncbi:hypothetical protein AVEN_229518-1 [Araneus ventricosus]|uniref:Uncharacterized protein n=1 Tax=Araneus ventricosus TaxID=182803 RepID=A0A4Y2EKC4_ARAVE|nr:hypothetical protein AVEN_229518-1 [Araneus ventricosus]
MSLPKHCEIQAMQSMSLHCYKLKAGATTVYSQIQRIQEVTLKNYSERCQIDVMKTLYGCPFIATVEFSGCRKYCCGIVLNPDDTLCVPPTAVIKYRVCKRCLSTTAVKCTGFRKWPCRTNDNQRRCSCLCSTTVKSR